MPDIDPDHPVWQRSFYDHIIRSQQDLDRIRTYIDQNPAHWAEDALFAP